jgi:hypothetical protein
VSGRPSTAHAPGSWKPLRGRRRSVFIGFRETAGYLGNLAVGLDAIGVRVTLARFGPNPWGYRAFEQEPLLVRLVGSTRRRRSRHTGWRRPIWTALDRAATAILFGWALLTHDTFIFFSASSFFQLRELALLRRLGKTIVFVFLGSDSRPGYLNGAEVGECEPADIDRAVASSRGKRRALARIEQYADVIVCHALSAQLHRRPVVAFLNLGIPYPIAGQPASVPPNATGTVRILHAPSRPEAKGTAEFREAIESLRAEGHAIEYVELIGQPNRAVLQALTDIDFVVDQPFADTPMGTFPAEAAAIGKPAVVGGFGWEELSRVTSPDALPPAATCHPDDLRATIRDLVIDVDRRVRLGEAARRFLEDHWAPEMVAARYLRLIEGNVPAEWMLDPAEVRYVHGAGLSLAQVVRVVETLEASHPSALAELERPDLEAMLLSLARVRSAGARPPPPGTPQ